LKKKGVESIVINVVQCGFKVLEKEVARDLNHRRERVQAPRKINELRNRAHYGAYLSRYDDKCLDMLKTEIEEAKSLVAKLSTIEASSWILRELVDCLKKPLETNLLLIAQTS
jgi:hypothetical protein